MIDNISRSDLMFIIQRADLKPLDLIREKIETRWDTLDIVIDGDE
jgi:hypothetical protein